MTLTTALCTSGKEPDAKSRARQNLQSLLSTVPLVR